ncbi:MAG: UxaA family hydrolase [Hyphomicrobiaceae bacterium]|nr:UxaA family hydrolase [Hyphomicrobiaceae bacterium]
MPRALVLNPTDNVATLIDPGKASEVAECSGGRQEKIILRGDVPFGHKCALQDIAAGEKILKYGQVIGRATRRIQAGEHVHVHNVEALRARGDIEGRA